MAPRSSLGRYAAALGAGDAERAGEPLRASELRARAVLDTAMTAIVGFDERGRIESFSRGAEQMFGYAAAEAIGQHVGLLMPELGPTEGDGATSLPNDGTALAGPGRERAARRKDGTAFPIHVCVDDVARRDRRLFTAVIRDLTQHRAAEERERTLFEQALQNERLADIGAMTVRIAHDFGNPLAALHMAAQQLRRLLGREPVPVDRLRAVIDTMVETTKRLDVFVGEFKEIAREQRLHLGDVVVPAFLAKVVAAWRHEAAERRIVLEGRVAGDLPMLRADENKLRRVLDNLVKNALEAVALGPGAVRVTAEPWGAAHVRITVEDTGPGLPDGTDVFGMFETTKPTGTGLGLPICKQIVQAHGGGIACAPRAPHGAIFTVELPIQGPATLQL